jgi:hypothetical protein
MDLHGLLTGIALPFLLFACLSLHEQCDVTVRQSTSSFQILAIHDHLCVLVDSTSSLRVPVKQHNKLNSEDGAGVSSETLARIHRTTRRHISEKFNLKKRIECLHL